MDGSAGLAGVLAADLPAVGWRYWQLARSGRIRSVTQKWIEWVPAQALRAVCLELHHPAPADDCNCGIYAHTDRAALLEHGLCLVPGAAVVIGQVALWGRVVDHDGSLRGELARPSCLSLVADTLSTTSVDDALARLAAYGVPVATVDLGEAVAGASAAMLGFQQMSMEASRRWS